MSDIYESLRYTEYGETLNNNIRFGRFKPDWLDNQVWVELLGMDVNNYEHMQYTAGLTTWYIQTAEEIGYPFPEEDAARLLTTAWVHDFAEAIDGDVPDPFKKDDEDTLATERRSFIKVASLVAEDPEELADFVFPVLHGSNYLSRHFRAIELMGYMETGLRALRSAHSMGELEHTYGFSHAELREIWQSLTTLGNEVVASETTRLPRDFWDLPVVQVYMNEVI